MYQNRFSLQRKCSLEKSCLIKVFLFFLKELFSYIWKDFFAGDTKAREGLQNSEKGMYNLEIKVQGTGRTTLSAMLCLYTPFACSFRSYLRSQNVLKPVKREDNKHLWKEILHGSVHRKKYIFFKGT